MSYFNLICSPACYVYNFLLGLTVPKYAQNFIRYGFCVCMSVTRFNEDKFNYIIFNISVP